MVWISSFRGFTANLILDPEQQVFDACAVSVHWPIISSVVLIVWNRMCRFFVLLIRKIPAHLQNATSAFWRKIKSLSVFKNPCFSMCHLRQKLNVLFCRIASFNIYSYLFILNPQSCPPPCHWTVTWRNRSTYGRIAHPTSWQRRPSMLLWQHSNHTVLSAHSSVHTQRYRISIYSAERWLVLLMLVN